MLMVVQAACRAIIVDTLPAQKQEIGNAWASRMVAGGHLIGYTMYPSTIISPSFPLSESLLILGQGICEFDESVVFLGGYTVEGYLFFICAGTVYYRWNHLLQCLRTSPHQTRVESPPSFLFRYLTC